MEDSAATWRTGRVLLRNLAAGAIGLIPALALLLTALRFQDFLPALFISLTLFVCPIPIASGVLVGFVSPRKALAWAPLWAAILAVLLLVLVSGSLHEAGAAFSAVRVLNILIGGAVAALAGWAGRWAVRHGHVGKLVAAIVAACCLMAVAGLLLMRQEMALYKRDSQPQVLSEVDRDYIRLGSLTGWKCERLINEGCYAMESTLRGQRIRVLSQPDMPALICVEYSCTGKSSALGSSSAARSYLLDMGVRQALLRGLVESKVAPGNWSSILQGTRLSLSSDGRVRLFGIPLRDVSRESTP